MIPINRTTARHRILEALASGERTLAQIRDLAVPTLTLGETRRLVSDLVLTGVVVEAERLACFGGGVVYRLGKEEGL